MRDEHWGPRTLDVDVLLVGDLVVERTRPRRAAPALARARVCRRAAAGGRRRGVARLAARLDTSGVRRVASLWGEFDTSVRPADAARVVRRLARAVGGRRGLGDRTVRRASRSPSPRSRSRDRPVADVHRLHDQLAGWELFFPSPGRVYAVATRRRRSPTTSTNCGAARRLTRCGPSRSSFEDIRDGVLHYRRDPSITLPLDEAIMRTADGIPYVAPHLQLLYKAKHARRRDEEDFAAAAPPAQRRPTRLARRHTRPPDALLADPCVLMRRQIRQEESAGPASTIHSGR